MNAAAPDGRNSAWSSAIVIVLVIVGCFAVGTWISVQWSDRSAPVPAHAPVPSAPPADKTPATSTEPSQDQALLRQYRDLDERCRSQGLDARAEFLKLAEQRQRNGLGEDWEREAAVKLEQARSAEEAAANRLVSLALRADSESNDSGFFLRQRLAIPAESDDSRLVILWEKWFANLDQADGPQTARRFLSDRLADLIAIRTTAQPLSLLTLNEQRFPLLTWAAKAAPTQFRTAFDQLQTGSFPFISPQDCEAAHLVATAFPSTDGKPTEINPLAQLAPDKIASLKKQLALERKTKLEGFSDEQRAAASKVFEMMEQFLANEEQRAIQVHRQNWTKRAL